MFRSKSDKYALLPKHFECPLSTEEVKEPAVLPCGHVNEKSEITKMLDHYDKKVDVKLCCPQCRKEFDKTKVNYSLKEGWEALRSRLATAETDFANKDKEFKKLKTETDSKLQEDSEQSQTIYQLQTYVVQLERDIRHFKAESEKKLSEQRNLHNQELHELKIDKRILETQLKQSREALIEEGKIHIQKLDYLRTEKSNLESQLKALQTQIESLSLELKREREKSATLEDKNKKMESHFFISHSGQESKSNNESLFSLAEKLQIIFDHEKNILKMFPVLENANEISGVYNRLTHNLNLIVFQKKNKKSAKETKAELIRKCKADSIKDVDLTQCDAKQISERLILIQQQFTKDMKTQDDIINESDKKIKEIKKNSMDDFCKFLQLVNERRSTLKKIAHEVSAYEVNAKGLEKFAIQKRLFPLAFFRNHQQSLQRLVTRSKQNVAFRTYVKEKEYKKIETEFKKLSNPNIAPKIDGYTIVQYAVVNKDAEMISSLIEAKADFNFIFSLPKNDANKYTCLTYLLEQRNDYLYKKYDGPVPKKYDAAILKLINYMDIKTLNYGKSGDNALALAIKTKNTDFVISLLQRKTPVTLIDVMLLKDTRLYDGTVLTELRSNPAIYKSGELSSLEHDYWNSLRRPVRF